MSHFLIVAIFYGVENLSEYLSRIIFIETALINEFVKKFPSFTNADISMYLLCYEEVIVIILEGFVNFNDVGVI